MKGSPPLPTVNSSTAWDAYAADDAEAEKSEAVSLEERLAELEKKWEEREAEEEAQAEEAEGKPTLKINGRIHLDYWNFADESEGIGFFENPDSILPGYGVDTEDRVFFRRIRLNFQGDLVGPMLYRMQIDFNSPATGEMKDMYIGFKDVPLLGKVLIGNQKRPLGLDHLNSSRFNVFIERPLVVEAFNEDARRLGIAGYNNTEDESLAWQYGVFAMENLVRSGRIIGDSLQSSGNARLHGSPWYDEQCDGRNYFHWAVSGMVAKPDGDTTPADFNFNEGRFRTRPEARTTRRWLNTGRIAGADWYEILGFESILNLGPFQVVGEYQSNWLQRDDVTAGTGPDLHFQGAYVYVAYMLTGEHIPYSRTSGTIGRVSPVSTFSPGSLHSPGERGWGAWQVAARYSYLDLSDNDILGGVENNVTLGLVWYFSSHASLQFNAIYGDIDEHAPVNNYTSGHFTALGARLRANF